MAEKILVTGATGFAGRWLLPRLIAAGYDVRGQYNRHAGTLDDVEWRPFDMVASLDFDALVEGCAGVVHLAAALNDASLMDRVNVDASEALVGASEAAGVKYFSYASSCVVYGSPKSRFVSEDTPRLDPRAPMDKQYYAEPYMLDYARTKTLAEQAIEAASPKMVVDMLRPVVVADHKRLLEGRDWNAVRRLTTLYRQTNYMYAGDTADAMVHLLRQGLSGQRGPGIEAWNLADPKSGTFVKHFRHALGASGDPRWKAALHVPVVADMGKDFMRFRQPQIRYPLGMLRFSTEKLSQSGFEPTIGVARALEDALTGERALP